MRYLGLAVVVALVLSIGMPARANDFIADSNQFGYSGTVQNVTKNTDPEAIPQPRDASVYFTKNPVLAGYVDWGDYNNIMSNWYQHPASDSNAGFFQIGDIGGGTVTSASGAWSYSGSSWDFSLTVTGENANYRNSTARLWQPDLNDGMGGTYLNYTYTLTATGMATEVVDGWRYNTTDPTGITGSLQGTFLLTYAGDSNLDGILNGTTGNGGYTGGPWDTYVVHLNLDKNLWDGNGWSDTYTDDTGTYVYGNYSTFGAPVPEPATMLLLGSGFVGLLGVIRRRRGK